MLMSDLIKKLSAEGFDVVGIKGNKVEVKMLWNNGKGYQREIFKVTVEGIIHLGAYENSDNEIIDIKIENEKVEKYIKEDL